MKFVNNSEYIEETFENAALPETEIEKVTFDGCHFIRCDFTQSRFRSCKFIECRFSECNLSLADLTGSAF